MHRGLADAQRRSVQLSHDQHQRISVQLLRQQQLHYQQRLKRLNVAEHNPACCIPGTRKSIHCTPFVLATLAWCIFDTHHHTLQDPDTLRMQAYIACLNLFAAGMKLTQTSSYDSSSLAVDLIYEPSAGVTEPAVVYGLQTTGPVTCTLKGPSLPTGWGSCMIHTKQLYF